MIIVIVAIIIIGFFFFWKYNKAEITGEPDEFFCNTSSDCIKIETSCCPCSSGGEEICGNMKQLEKYEKEKENCGDNIFCVAMYNCHITECDCIDNKCTSIEIKE